MTACRTELRDDVLTVTLNRPAARNALSADLLRELAATFRAVATDAGVDVVIVTGADPAFCAGLDLRELAADPTGLVAVATAESTNPFRMLRDVPQPVIGAVNGPAVTGGLELALACDFLVASRRASFADTHARVGVLPAQGLPALLSAAVGAPLARMMSLTGNAIDAETALRAGLVTHVVEHDALLPVCRKLAADIRAGHRGAVRAVKGSYSQGLRGTREEWLALDRTLSERWRFDNSVATRAGQVVRRGNTDPTNGGR